MTKRTRKRRIGITAAAGKRFKPKGGPGAVYVEEFVSARTGREQRLRNIGEHPLTLAHARGRINDEQFAAGEELRELCELRAASGRDSTDITLGAGGRTSLPFTQKQVDAIRSIGIIRARLKSRDWVILEKFCGEGWPMADAVRAATLCHPSGVALRMQEALDELVEARDSIRSPRAGIVTQCRGGAP